MKIKVPDIKHKTLCYKQKLTPPGAMRRCTLLKNHKGAHYSGGIVWGGNNGRNVDTKKS